MTLGMKKAALRSTLLVTVVSMLIGLVACSDDDEGPDVAGSCREACTTSSFQSSRVDEQSNETNCFCNGGTGNVSDQTCQDLCNKIGRPKASTFNQGVGGNKDACQCSP